VAPGWRQYRIAHIAGDGCVAAHPQIYARRRRASPAQSTASQSYSLSPSRVTAGSFGVSTDVDLIGGAADSSCPRDGVLAMDVLRSCSLLLGRSRVYGRCTPPTAAAPALWVDAALAKIGRLLGEEG